MKKFLNINKITLIVIVISLMLCTGLSAVAVTALSQQQINVENEITIHYYNDTQWENPYIYCYINDQEDQLWPGTAMFAEGGDWYSYTVSGFDEVRVIFSNNGSNQNPGQNQDGYLVSEEMWYCSGIWYDQKPQSTIVHYYNSDKWNSVHLYYYQDGLTGPDWPGVEMQRDSTYWYTYEIIGFDSPKVIFSNNGSNQIPAQNEEGFSVSGEKWYKEGVWYDEDPSVEIEINPLKVHYYNYGNWDNVNVYYYQDGITTPSWPGVNMDSEGDGWFEYEITDCTNPKVIFSNNGNNQIPSQNQEGFSVTKESWYKNGVWYEYRPTDIVVYFYKPDGWNDPYIYYYESENDTGPSWPGTAMNDMENGWYNYTITKYSTAKVLFNDKSNQIPATGESGYEVSGVMWYKDGEWYTYNPDTMDSNQTVGDLNGDGVIDINDSNLLNNYLSDNEQLTDEQKKLADANGDGVLDDKDIKLLDKYIAGEITEFPSNSELTNRNVSYEYDKLGRVTKVIYDTENYIEYVYDKNGNITDIKVTGEAPED